MSQHSKTILQTCLLELLTYSYDILKHEVALVTNALRTVKCEEWEMERGKERRVKGEDIEGKEHEVALMRTHDTKDEM